MNYHLHATDNSPCELTSEIKVTACTRSCGSEVGQPFIKWTGVGAYRISLYTDSQYKSIRRRVHICMQIRLSLFQQLIKLDFLELCPYSFSFIQCWVIESSLITFPISFYLIRCTFSTVFLSRVFYFQIYSFHTRLTFLYLLTWGKPSSYHCYDIN